MKGIKKDFMDFKKIVEVIAKAARKRETIEIYYPKTENNSEGWREIEPYGLSTDTGPEGEHLIYGRDIVEPGHILNAFSLKGDSNHCRSFILGKIKKARPTQKKFKPKWEIEF